MDSLKSVYIHPLSQIVLEHFSKVHHSWIVFQKLDDRLTIHRDGTFELEFPDESPTARIWTAYDAADKKHWLAFRTPDVQHRFMLQDNLMPAWHGNKRQSLPERVRRSVDELVKTVDAIQRHTQRIEQQNKGTNGKDPKFS